MARAAARELPVHRDKEPAGCVVTFFDIMERVKTEECLRRSEEQCRSIINRAPYGIYRVDLGGGVILANPALVVMLGYKSQNEVIGLNIASEIECGSRHQSSSPSVNSASVFAYYEARWKRKDGRIVTVRLAERHLVKEQDDSVGFEVFVEDITEQRMLQKQCEHARKMETLGQLAGGVAHDLNNLLRIIDSYAQLVEECSGDRENVLQYARKIQDAGSKASSVSRQLFALSQRHVQETTVFDLNHVVEDLSAMLTRLLGEDSEVTLNLEPLPVWVHADRGQIEQVITNLAVNARDAMPNGGRLGIETSMVQLSAQFVQHDSIDIPTGDYVMLAVSDTGTGMDAETRAHIFEPFCATKGAGKGTGLGLATVYGFVKQNRGFVWVYSDLGKGSILRVYLPAVDAALSKDSPVVETAARGCETVLVVEDEAALREVVRMYLESRGYIILAARNATDALKICCAHKGPIHVLFTDLLMSGPGGVELARAALGIRPGLRVLLASGDTEGALDDETIRTVGALLLKPFSLNSLARKLRLVIDESRGIVEAAC